MNKFLLIGFWTDYAKADANMLSNEFNSEKIEINFLDRFMLTLIRKTLPGFYKPYLYRLVKRQINEPSEYSCIICCENDIVLQILEMHLFSEIEKICLIRNTSSPLIKRFKCLKKSKVFTFDLQDSKKHDIGLYKQYCALDTCINQRNIKLKQDLYFVGMNKDRSKILNKIKKNNKNLSTKIIVFPDIKNIFDEFIFHLCKIRYHQNLKNISESKYILEIVKKDQAAFSTRAIEALFYGVKVVTNIKNIQDYDLYDKTRFYQISQENNFKIPDSFINSEFRELTNDQKSEHTFNGVIKGLIKSYEKYLKN